MKEEFVTKLHAFVETYLLQSEAMKEDMDDKAVTEAVLKYMEASRELLDYIKDIYKEENPKLPSLEMFFFNGHYHDYARRIYAGILGSGKCWPDEAWKLAAMVEIGTILKENWNKSQ